jgi:hypothetical protein
MAAPSCRNCPSELVSDATLSGTNNAQNKASTDRRLIVRLVLESDLPDISCMSRRPADA